MKSPYAFVFILLACLIAASCRKDESDEIKCDGSNPSYNGQIRAIINANCTSASCHPDFTTYSGLQGVIQNGRFEREVLVRKSMPKNGRLSAQELVRIRCWADNGYREN